MPSYIRSFEASPFPSQGGVTRKAKHLTINKTKSFSTSREDWSPPPWEGLGEAPFLMINYVNNSFDKVLKPCDAQKFAELTQSELTEKLILGHRAGEKNSKAKLPALTYMGVLDEPRYRAYLEQCEAQGTKPLGSRRAEFMRPTGLLMLDFDHIGKASPQPSPEERGSQSSRAVIDSPIKLWEYIKSRYESESPFLGGLGETIALAHITPSGDGLRVVLRRTKDVTIEHDQWAWCELMRLDAKPDPACKDISRLSFAPMHKDVLYFNPSLLFGELPNAGDYPDGSLWGGTLDCPPSVGGRAQSAEGVSVAASHTTSPLRGTPPTLGGESQSFPEDYNGVEYKEIVLRLEEQLGGRPAQGARNSFIFTMACNLRYICNDDAAWIASILPTYGEDAQKHRQTIQSAINRPMSRTMPDTMARALNVAKLCSEGDPQPSTLNPQPSGAPALPSALPQPVSLLVSRTPEKMKAAVAMSVFPPLGAHLRGVDFAYWDGRAYEPTFMNVVVAELSRGKSAVNTPIEYILADIEDRDEVALGREREWKDKCSRISTTQDKPERPKGLVVQILPSDMTNAAFVQRLADADGHFLYTQMDEIELLNALKTNTAGNNVSAILRLAFDCGKYGQARVAANAINAKVRVRWNWNASSTVQRVRKFFAKNIADGTLSRISFATIVKTQEDRYGRNRPKYLAYGDSFADELRPYIDRLTTCSGTLVCPEAQAWAERLCDEMSDFAEEVEDETYATMSFRAVLMGFFRAMVLYVMNGCQWSIEIAEFAAWSVRYDLWCKMRFFRDMLHSDLQGEETSKQRGPVGLLSMLPNEFTREDVKALRIAQGMKPDPSALLRKWVERSLVVRVDGRNVYTKVCVTA